MDKNSKVELLTLGKLALVCSGYSPRPDERQEKGKYLLLGGRNIKDGRLVKTNKDSYIDEVSKNSFSRGIAQPGDIIISTLFDVRKLYIYKKEDPPSVVNNSCAIIRAPDKNDYIISYLRTLQGREKFLKDASNNTSGTVIKRLTIKALSNIKVPLLPLSELQKLGDEHISSASTDELMSLQKKLHSKDDLIFNLKTKIEHLEFYYEDRIQKIKSQIEANDIMTVINHGETSKIEFKSSLRWNLKAKRDDKNIELSVLKTIAAFCNTEGGELLIGVSDNQEILGIEYDHFSNNDKFLLHLRNLITDKLIPNVAQYTTFDLVSIGDKKICRVVCKKSSQDIWVKTEKNKPEIFYVRTGPSSTQLFPRDATKYILDHFADK